MDYDPTGFLPTPNLWERLTDAGVRPVIVHPSSFFQDFPLSKMLYRGAQRYGYLSLSDINPSLLLDDNARTLVVVYLFPVDRAAHLHGQLSVEYCRALKKTRRRQLWIV